MPRARLRSAVSGRGFMLLPAAAFAVHQLRYLVGYGADAPQALSAQGHGYLDSLAPWVGLLLAVGFGAFLVRCARAAAGSGAEPTRRSFAGLWLLATASLAAVYIVQEALEGVLASGHPAGVAGIVGHGGWWALVLAALAGAAVAALLRVAGEVVDAVARLSRTRSAGRPAVSLRRPTVVLIGPRVAPLASARAGRAPPAGPRARLA